MTSVRKSRVAIDHIYPVGRVIKDLELQKQMKRHGIKGVNDKKNLTPACERCNRTKGMQIDGWVKKGIRGRHQYRIFFGKLIKITAITIIGYYLYMHWENVMLSYNLIRLYLAITFFS